MFRKSIFMLFVVLVCAFFASGQEIEASKTAQAAESQPTAQAPLEKKRKFQIGVQFGSSNEERSSLGGRLGYDFATFGKGKYVATAEMEFNYFPISKYNVESPQQGRLLQGFAGVKIGRRFEKFGVFAKARPGFMHYTKGEQTVSISPQSVDFFTKGKTNFAADIGGVLEFYPSKRIITRFDFGDTIIRQGQAKTVGFTPFPNPQWGNFTIPAKTRHTFQFGAGIGFRF